MKTFVLVSLIAFANLAFIREDGQHFDVRWEQSMDEMGPPLEWPDASAPNLETLKRGSVIEVTQTFTVLAGQNYIVEQNGLLEASELSKIPHPTRFANVWLMNGNDGIYHRPATYTKGMKMKVLGVTPKRENGPNAWTEYEIKVKILDKSEWPFQIVDPIVSMNVLGRRSGRAEVKLPQFIEMMKPYMSVSPL